MLSWLRNLLCCATIGAVVISDSTALEAVRVSKHPPKMWCGPIVRAYDVTQRNTDVVTLIGTLTRQPEWGPPNFGENPETDKKWLAWILQLDFVTPIALMDDRTPAKIEKVVKIRELQARGVLEYPGGYEEFANQHIAVDGQLWRANAPADVTEIIIHAKQIRVIGEVRCDGQLAPQKA